MTLKHISFSESPVMRELARQAVSSGSLLIEPIKKTAETKNVLSNSLFPDVVLLAQGLREMGLIAEAEHLDSKLLEYKRAQKDLWSDLLHNAHPKGSQHIADSKDSNGEVEDLIDKHEKILQVINKKPTGKQADFLAEIVKCAAEVLKIGQAAEGEENAKDFFSDVRIAKEKNINQINKLLQDNLPSVSKNIQGLINDVLSRCNFDGFIQSGILNNKAALKLYGDMAAVNSDAIVEYFNRFKLAFGEEKGNDQYLLDQLNKSDSKVVSAFVKSIAPDVNIFQFFPPPPKEEPQTGWESVKDSIWTGAKWVGRIAGDALGGWIIEGGVWAYNLGKDSENVHKILNAVKNSLNAQYTALLGPETVKKANGNFSVYVGSYLKNLEAGGTQLSQIELLDIKISTSNNEVVNGLMSVQSVLNKTDWPSLIKLVEGVVDLSNDTSIFQGILSTLENVKSEIVKHPLSSGDIIHSTDQVKQLAGNIYGAAEKIVQYVKGKYKEGTKEYTNWMSQATQFLNVSKIINAHQNKQWGELSKALAEVFPVESFDDLVKKVNYYAEQTTKLASNQIENIKLGQIAPPTSKSTVQTSTSTTPTVNSGNAAPKVGNEESVAVKEMQIMLSNVAQLLAQNPKITGQDVGALATFGPNKKTPNILDGAWGPQTTAALTVAKKYAPSIIPNRDPAKATQLAKSNTEILRTLYSKLGGKGESGENLDGTPVSKIFDRELRLVNLLNLANFCQWAQSVEGFNSETNVNANGEITKGFGSNQLNTLLSKIYEDAKSKYDNNRNNELITKYYSMIIKLYNAFLKVVSDNHLNVQNNDIIPENLLKNNVNNHNSNKGLNHSSKPDAQGRLPGDAGYSGSEDMGGSDEKQAPGYKGGLPFDDIIDFRSPSFSFMVNEFPIAKRMGGINVDDLLRIDTTTFINQFRTSAGPKDQSQAIEKALTDNGIIKGSQIGNYQYSNDGNLWIKTGPGNTDWTPISTWLQNNPQIQKSVNLVSNVNPRQKATEFLNYLLGAINDSKAKWLSYARPTKEEVINLNRWQSKWLETIQDKISEIQGV